MKHPTNPPLRLLLKPCEDWLGFELTEHLAFELARSRRMLHNYLRRKENEKRNHLCDASGLYRPEDPRELGKRKANHAASRFANQAGLLLMTDRRNALERANDGRLRMLRSEFISLVAAVRDHTDGAEATATELVRGFRDCEHEGLTYEQAREFNELVKAFADDLRPADDQGGKR